MSDYSIIVWVAIISVVAGALVAAAVYLIDRNADRQEK
jgi:hypothetical protein